MADMRSPRVKVMLSNELRKTKIDRNFLLGLTISRDGKIKAIHVVAGDKVADEDIILELE